MQHSRRWMLQRVALASASVSLSLPAWALDKPAGEPVLTVRGKIKIANGAGVANFDMPMLERMAQRSFTTRTPWYEGPKKFTGPLLRDVLQQVGGQGSTLRAIALNDYKVDIPLEDAFKFDVLLARLLDDKPMPVRDKGPLFIIYPFDDKAELRDPRYFARCAWQLRTIELV